MAEENQDGQEKTEEPTQRRLDKAAEEGRVLTSKEVMVFTSLAMGLVLYLALGPFMWSGLSAWGGLFVIDSALNLDTLGLVKVRYAFWLVILVTLIVELFNAGAAFQRQSHRPAGWSEAYFLGQGAGGAGQVDPEGGAALWYWRDRHLHAAARTDPALGKLAWTGN